MQLLAGAAQIRGWGGGAGQSMSVLHDQQLADPGSVSCDQVKHVHANQAYFPGLSLGLTH